MTDQRIAWTLRDCESGVTEQQDPCTLMEAREAADSWARGGDYDVESTIWVDVAIVSPTGEIEETVTIAIDPDEPSCAGRRESHREHDWQSPIEIVGGISENPGVWGHGGGVTIREVCMRCGCGRFTDTWAQRPDTGEQGLTSISYTESEYVQDDS